MTAERPVTPYEAFNATIRERLGRAVAPPDDPEPTDDNSTDNDGDVA